MISQPKLMVLTQRSPFGGEAHVRPTADGVEIRCVYWPASISMTPRGTIFLLNGRTEFIEKYAEAADDCIERGFCVVSLDWRGQGLSRRLLADHLKGHVGDFAEYQHDLAAVTEFARTRALPRPWLTIAHSMGGHNALRHATLGASSFDALMLSAPMCEIFLPKPLWLIETVISLGARFTPGAYAPGQGPPLGSDTEFDGNRLTSDPVRFAVMVEALAREPLLRLGGVTFGWLAAALSSMRAVLAPGVLERLDVPVVIAAAGDDRIVNAAIYGAITTRLRRGELVHIAGARHEILREQDRFRDQFWTAFDALCARLGV